MEMEYLFIGPGVEVYEGMIVGIMKFQEQE